MAACLPLQPSCSSISVPWPRPLSASNNSNPRASRKISNQVKCRVPNAPEPYASGRASSTSMAMAAAYVLSRKFGGFLSKRAHSTRFAGHGHRIPQHSNNRSRTVALAAWKQEVLWAETPLVEVERAAESLFHLVLDISDSPELMSGHTTPGQFVQVRVGESRPAFLAIASPPATASGGSLEFLVKYVEGTTAGLLCNLGRGHTVELSPVLGRGFDTRQISPPEKYAAVFLFATGSGISPIRSLLESGLDANKRSDVRLYYGARNLQKMAYQERFKDWESSGVKVIPVLSQPDDSWTGERGYIQAAFARAKQILKPLATGAVLCGHKQMAEDVASLLLSEGVLEEKILKNF